MSKPFTVQEYAGSLAAFGDPVLDDLVARGRAIKDTRKVRAGRAPEPARCPSCGHVRVLVMGYKAVICQECHDGITELAKRRLW